MSRRWLRIEAAVTRALTGNESRHLAIKAEDAAVNDWDILENTRVVHEVARRKIIDAIHDHVPTLVQDAIDVRAREALLVLDDLDVWIEVFEGDLRAIDLGHMETGSGVEDLTL